MSNERSPREVCSITIGMSGLIAPLLLAGRGPQSCLCLVSFLLGCPELLACGRELDGDPLHLRGDAVEGAGEAKRLARLGPDPLDELVAGAAGDLEVGVERDAAALERQGEPLEERAGTRLDERAGRLHLRRLGERAHGLLPERGLGLEL